MRPNEEDRSNGEAEILQLADRAGISPSYLSQIESGKRDGSFTTIAMIARALDIDLDDLAPWSGNSPANT